MVTMSSAGTWNLRRGRWLLVWLFGSFTLVTVVKSVFCNVYFMLTRVKFDQ